MNNDSTDRNKEGSCFVQKWHWFCFIQVQRFKVKFSDSLQYTCNDVMENARLMQHHVVFDTK